MIAEKNEETNSFTNPVFPNFNTVLFRAQANNPETESKFEFFTSDIEGQLEIAVITISKENKISYARKVIHVK